MRAWGCRCCGGPERQFHGSTRCTHVCPKCLALRAATVARRQTATPASWTSRISTVRPALWRVAAMDPAARAVWVSKGWICPLRSSARSSEDAAVPCPGAKLDALQADSRGTVESGESARLDVGQVERRAQAGGTGRGGDDEVMRFRAGLHVRCRPAGRHGSQPQTGGTRQPLTTPFGRHAPTRRQDGNAPCAQVTIIAWLRNTPITLAAKAIRCG